MSDDTTADPAVEPTEAPSDEAVDAADGGSAAMQEPADGSPAATEEPAESRQPAKRDAADSDRLKQLEREGDIAADYLEELLDIADLDGDLDMDVEGDRASVSIVGGGLNRLVGSKGEVLDALQELTRLAVQRETGDRSRLMLDIGGHRARRRKTLEESAQDAVARVKESGEPLPLSPMTPFERKVVHDAVAAAGLASDSEGVEPHRYVVIRPSS